MQQQARQLKDKHNQIEKLKRNYHQLEQRYGEICSENKLLNSKIRSQEQQEQEKRTREAELKLTREKARVKEEERQLVRTQYDKRRRDEEQFLDFKKT